MNRYLQFQITAILFALVSNVAIAIELPRGGINLTGYRYWNPAHPFNNVANMAGEWISFPTAGGAWDDGRAISLTDNGYPAALLPGQGARTLIFTHNNSNFPTGNYEVQWNGTGAFRLDNAQLISSSANRATYRVTNPTNTGLLLEVTSTSNVDPLRDIRVALPGTDPDTDNIRSDYAEDLGRYGVLRYMDWNSTNNHPISEWTNRVELNDFHWGSEKGLPYEMQIDYSNDLQSDMWITVPHLASDDYVRNLAQLVKSRLDPELRVWVEYSNEVWNSLFEQHDYARDVLMPRFGAGSPMEAYGRRTAEIFEIFEEEIGNPGDLVKVVSGHSANAWQLEQAMLGITAGSNSADVVGIAPYFTLQPAAMASLFRDYQADTIDSDAIFRNLADEVDRLASYINANKSVADTYGVPLVAYEGGQHLVGYTGEQRNDEGFVALLADINRDPRMKGLYEQMLQVWDEGNGETFAFFSDVGAWGRSGFWGLKENLDDDDSPKFNAVQEYLTYLGDFDGNGEYECSDVDRIVAEIAGGGSDAAFDLDADGLVDESDLELWLAIAGESALGPGRSFLRGDANLSGTVDVSDFNIWNSRKFTSSPAWCQADFNADGTVDVSDFNLWNANKFQSSDSIAVPEPTTAEILGWMIGLIACTTGCRKWLRRDCHSGRANAR